MWYIGQKIVAIKNHSQGKFKEGDIFHIQGLRQGCCTLVIDIGKQAEQNSLSYCDTHNYRYPSNGVCWFKETCFAPLDEITAHESAIKELLKETQVEV